MALDRALRRAGVDYSVGIEAEGWSQMMRFVSLGVGLAIVNGCVTTPDGLVARPVIDLPSITYSVIQRKEAMSDDVRPRAARIERAVTRVLRPEHKRLSWLLRHGANEAGLVMDEAGWAEIADVLEFSHMARDDLDEAVATNDKGRLQTEGSRGSAPARDIRSPGCPSPRTRSNPRGRP